MKRGVKMAETYRIWIKKGDIEIEVEGDKDFVEKHIKEFKGELQKVTEKALPEEKSVSQVTEKKEEIKLENLSLAEFYKMKQPKDHNETVVVFSYWLMIKEGKEEIRPKDIGECYSKIGIRKPTNIPHTMKILASGRKAYLSKTEKRGIYKIGMYGKELVEKELPRKSDKQ